jgi:hypothetical protein
LVRRKPAGFAWIVSIGLVAILLIGLTASLGLNFGKQYVHQVIQVSLALFALLTLVNLIRGSTVKNFHHMLRDRCFSFLLKREAAALGVKVKWEVGGLEK